MTAVLTLFLVVAGLLMIVGGRELAKKLVFAVFAATLLIAAVRCLLCELRCQFSGVPGTSAGGGWFWVLLVCAAITVGFVAWKTRPLRQNRLADLRGRSMHPRRLAPPSAPNASPDDDGIFP